ncbi:hypothetical protein FSP39_000152 [Pinctada imbricata]|uniref:Nose resistant-to-fluoxetine protein N-terminal domain-containing protein n=1 Tax=Pinctada imbricata TaxID=66713 RepID=A0AA88YF73_PINIB|nr:hypothetical protein FSP39_000152 [Pinctada imbricata]
MALVKWFAATAMVCVGLTLVLHAPRCQAQFDATTINALKDMPLKDKIAFIADLLYRNPALFGKLENILYAAFPLISNINLNPPLGQAMLAWLLDEIPALLQNELFLNVTLVVVDDLNKVNLTGVNMTDLDAFLDGFFARLDLYNLVKDVAVVICKPIFLERGLREELYAPTVAKSIELLEVFIRDYSERVIHVVIDVINDVNMTDYEMIQSGNVDNQTQSRSRRSVPQMDQTELAKYGKEVQKRLSLVTLGKEVLLNMSDVIGPYAAAIGLKPALIAPVLHGALDFGEDFMKTQLPSLASTVVQEINKVNVQGLNQSNPKEFFVDIGMRAAPALVSKLPVSVVIAGKQVFENINETALILQDAARMPNETSSLNGFLNLDIVNLAKQILLAKTARQYFPKATSQKGMSDMCYDDVMDYIDALLMGNKWAVEMFDATGKPPTGTLTGNLHFIGSYDQCLNIKYEAGGNGPLKSNSGKYCRAMFNIPQYILTTILGYTGPFDTHGVPLTLSLGLCLPSSCQPDDIQYLAQLGPLESLSLETLGAECSKTFDPSDDTDTIIFMCIAGIIVLLTAVSTLIHVICYHDDNHVVLLSKHSAHDNPTYERGMAETNVDSTNHYDHLQQNGHVQNGKPNGKVYEHVDDDMERGSCHSDEVTKPGEGKPKQYNHDQTNEGFKRQILKSFSLYKNVPSTLSFDREEGEVTCIHGIRVMSLALIVLGNSFLYVSLPLTGSPVSANLLDALDYLKMFTFQAVLSAPLATDTFFLISGCLVAKKFMERTEKAGKLDISKGFIAFYIHKYIRITPVYLIILIGYSRLYHYVGDGPMYPQTLPVADICKDTWWRHIIYANNLWGTEGNDAFHQCMPWSWFLACLMQFFLITPFLMVLFLMSKKLGTLCVSLLLLAGTVASALKEREFKGDILTTSSDGGAYWNNVFITPWCRVAPYCVGILLGYILYRVNNLHINKIIAAIVWFLSIGVCVSIVYSTFSKNQAGGHEWTDLQQQVYEALTRPAWALAVAWIIYACHNDLGGKNFILIFRFINGILSWNGFLPLSRLTFVAYLLHPIIMVLFVYTKRVLVYANNIEMIYMFLGHMILSYGGALMLSVLFERPFLNLERAIKKARSLLRD